MTEPSELTSGTFIIAPDGSRGYIVEPSGTKDEYLCKVSAYVKLHRDEIKIDQYMKNKTWNEQQTCH